MNICLVDLHSLNGFKHLENINNLQQNLKNFTFIAVHEADAIFNDYKVIAQLNQASICIIIGGDGFALRMFRLLIQCKIFHLKIYGINGGSLGFLMNEYCYNVTLEAQMQNTEIVNISPLKITGQKMDGSLIDCFAFNEVSIVRKSAQAAHIKITIDDFIVMPKFVGDGLIIATPAGSTAYNFAANGPIVPINANVLVMTPLAPFRPRRWSGAILEQSNQIQLDVLNSCKRPVHIGVDGNEVDNIQYIKVVYNSSVKIPLMFAQHDNLHVRTLKEQFYLNDKY